MRARGWAAAVLLLLVAPPLVSCQPEARLDAGYEIVADPLGSRPPSPASAESEALLEAHQQGRAHYEAGRYAEAIPYWAEALRLSERDYGPEQPATAIYLTNLAELYHYSGRYGEAEPLFRQALTIGERTLGPDHPSVATRLNNLAALYRAQGRYGEAEPLFRRATVIAEQALGPDHPLVGLVAINLAGLYRDEGRYGGALVYSRRASIIHGIRAVRGAEQRSGGNLSEQQSVRFTFVNHVEIALEAARGSDERAAAGLAAEAFEAGQLSPRPSIPPPP